MITKTKHIKSQRSKLPSLRFTEFEGNWDSKQLKEITSYVDYRGRGPQKSEQGIFLVTAKNIKKGFIDYKCSKEYVPIDNRSIVMSKGLPEVGDILFTTEAPLGNVAQVDNSDIALAQRVIKFRGKKEILNDFLLHYMISPIYQKLINRKANGTTVLGISGKELHKTNIQFPSLLEQQKIASFLSAVDEKIQQLNKKKELLEEYKKGLMQQLFSGELRFKDENGEAYADWERVSLGKHIDLFSGYAFKGKDISEDNHGIPLLRGINITEGRIRHSQKIDRFFTGELKDIEKLKVKVNDLVLSMDGSKVGKNSALITKKDEGALLVQRVARVRNLNTASIHFIYQHIRSSQFIRYVDIVNTSSGIPHISAKQIKEFKIDFPCLEEQQKIASFLTNIDTKIESVDNQIIRTQTFKKGLLQQMFV